MLPPPGDGLPERGEFLLEAVDGQVEQFGVRRDVDVVEVAGDGVLEPVDAFPDGLR